MHSNYVVKDTSKTIMLDSFYDLHRCIYKCIYINIKYLFMYFIPIRYFIVTMVKKQKPEAFYYMFECKRTGFSLPDLLP